MNPTKNQQQALNSLRVRTGYICPNCKEEGGQSFNIENPGEENTQIYCHYCRHYLFIEDYKIINK